MDRDAEVYLINDIPEKPKIQQDILVKRGDGKSVHTGVEFQQAIFARVSYCPNCDHLPFSHGNAKVLDAKAAYRVGKVCCVGSESMRRCGLSSFLKWQNLV